MLQFFLSLVVIIHNEETAIREFIEHYLAEDVQHFYIIDDGSTDNYRKVLADFNHNLFTIVRLDESLRHATTMAPKDVTVVGFCFF